MTRISYHASHEQFPPSLLLDLAEKAEKAGFSGCLSSDHFHPWSEMQGESAFAWSWLGAAMARTNLTFGIVNAPGQRYHPAIIAQAAATLAEMFPERFWLALGSGQALNERITGTRWPAKHQRNERLKESVEVIKALWSGETLNYNGKWITVQDAKLYTLPKKLPIIVGAALTEETARWVGGWADAMITISHPLEKLEKMIDEFRAGGGDGKPLILKLHVSYDTSEEEALKGAYEEWKTNIFESNVLSDLHKPAQLQNAAKFVQPEMMRDHVKIFVHPDQYIQEIRKHIDLGFDEIVIHNVNVHQEKFIEDFGSKVLPELK
jgi:coenzyme F420-dependent glucose-6-phosphate dehydrogenase